MRYHVVTLGCAKNTVDSMRLDQELRHRRHRAVADPVEAELLLVNTCGFIDAAKEESLSVIRELDDARSGDQQLFVIGCMTEIAEQEVLRAVPGVDATFGAEAWDQIASAVGPADPRHDIPEPRPLIAPGTPSAYLKISDGCDRPCTFCIIPTIKGSMHSAPRERLVAEARAYAAAGVSELVLVAQDSTAYAEDRGERDGLAALLEELAAAVPEVPWIRLMYAYPGRVTPRLARTMAGLPNVVPYLDIPLQHGSESVLRRMKRPGLRVARRSLEAIRAEMPDVVVRTTFIVGFPGESDAEFEELLDFVEEQRFEHVGAFTYSPQAGTPAARDAPGPGGVPDPELTQRRYGRLMELAQEISLERNRALLGRELDVLVESARPVESEGAGGPVVVGRTYRDAPEVDGLALLKGEHPAGRLIRARVDGALPYDLLLSPAGGAPSRPSTAPGPPRTRRRRDRRSPARGSPRRDR
ncbi:MAG: 30S ribosomal protein S12 methylthiotransferase RimO [Chloroflexi bacterium]|nr:30S ribosomal protein S12 methylthiotransferase RimO [Chloroflexota bacterium]